MKGVTREVVQNVVLSPNQVVPGDLSTLVAQSQWRGGLLRVPVYRDWGGTQVAHGLLDEPDETILEGATMIVRYDRDADVLLVKLRDEPPIDAVEEAGGIVISYGDKGLPVSVEFLNASQHGLVQPQDPRVTLAGLKAQG